MSQYVLCTYNLKTEAAASDYLTRWRKHIESLSAFAGQVHGFFSTATDPKKVVALISFPDDADVETALRDYAESGGFKEDMLGFDMEQISDDPKLLLRPGSGSPLS